MPFDSRLDSDAAGFRIGRVVDWSAGGQLRFGGGMEASSLSFEVLEQLATFGYRTHALTCCPCGADHSGELLAHKISIAAGAGTAASSIAAGGVQYAPPGSPEAQTFNLAGEVDGSTATTVTLAVGDIVNSQIEASGDQDWFRISLQAGVTYEFRLNATGVSGLGDPFLEIMNASGAQLKTNDDGGTGLNSLLRFTPTASGNYYINAHGWIDTDGSTSTGSYTLTTQTLPPIPTWTIDQIGQYLANEDGAGVGPRWQSSTITYNIEDLNANERIMAERALQMWSAASSLNFVRTTSVSAGITFVNAVADDPSAAPGETDPVAYARTSNSGNSIISSRIVISSNWTTLDPNAQAGWFDNYAQQTYIHEVGHALGLSHPGPYDGTAEYGTDNLFTNDNWAYTVMSYFDQLEVGHGNFRFVLGLQQADIAAIQLLYGANPAGTFAGNTTFGFNSSAPGTNIDWSQFVLVQPEGTYRRPPAMTLYDTSGVDTINLSGFAQPQIVDLRPGTYSSLGDRPDPSTPHYVNVVAIAANTIIENVIGGSGSDTITGNSANNTITLGAGADRFVYGANGGTDTITDFSVAQDRIDLTAFSSSVALAAFNGRTSSGGGTLLTFSSGQTILLQGVSVGQLTQTNLVLSASPPPPPPPPPPPTAGLTLIGTTSADALYGSGGNDQVYAGSGDDTIYGGAGNDAIYGENGNDVVYAAAGTDMIVGGDGADVLYGEADNDAIYGGLANDTLLGGDGDDTLFGEAGIDGLYGGLGNDTIVGGEDTDVLYGEAGNDVLYGGNANDTLIGADGDDTLYGEAGVDLLLGGNGADVILGGDSSDVLYGEDGDDRLYGEDGNDHFLGGNGNDTLYGGLGDDAVYGEGGNDVVYAGDGVDMIIGGDGVDVLYGEVGNDAIYGGTGSDTLLGGEGVDTLYGEVGADALYGGNGNDTLSGGSENDNLFGEGGNDTLYGGEGNDGLKGGDGNDNYFGGTGVDGFYLDNGSAGTLDRVFDFEQGSDVLHLLNSGFANFAAIQAAMTTISGTHTLITLPSGAQIRIDNILPGQFVSADFVISASAEPPPGDPVFDFADIPDTDIAINIVTRDIESLYTASPVGDRFDFSLITKHNTQDSSASLEAGLTSTNSSIFAVRDAIEIPANLELVDAMFDFSLVTTDAWSGA